MLIITTTELSPSQHTSILGLWNAEYPAALGLAGPQDLDRYLNGLSGREHFFVMTPTDEVLGWALSFTREEDTWFAMIIASGQHGRGYGRALLERLKAAHRRLNGWVIDREGEPKHDGTPYRSPVSFYLKNGFAVIADQRLETPVLSAVRIVWNRDPLA